MQIWNCLLHVTVDFTKKIKNCSWPRFILQKWVISMLVTDLWHCHQHKNLVTNIFRPEFSNSLKKWNMVTVMLPTFFVMMVIFEYMMIAIEISNSRPQKQIWSASSMLVTSCHWQVDLDDFIFEIIFEENNFQEVLMWRCSISDDRTSMEKMPISLSR